VGTVIPNFGMRLFRDRESYIGRPIRSNAHHVAAAADREENHEPGRRLFKQAKADDDHLSMLA
jgi:hypothetical protein